MYLSLKKKFYVLKYYRLISEKGSVASPLHVWCIVATSNGTKPTAVTLKRWLTNYNHPYFLHDAPNCLNYPWKAATSASLIGVSLDMKKTYSETTAEKPIFFFFCPFDEGDGQSQSSYLTVTHRPIRLPLASNRWFTLFTTVLWNTIHIKTK